MNSEAEPAQCGLRSALLRVRETFLFSALPGAKVNIGKCLSTSSSGSGGGGSPVHSVRSLSLEAPSFVHNLQV